MKEFTYQVCKHCRKVELTLTESLADIELLTCTKCRVQFVKEYCKKDVELTNNLLVRSKSYERNNRRLI